jgi:REP element-mobilizing transposase RayT
MSVKKSIDEYNGIFFITFTCCRWLPLFEISNGYDAVYRWFDSLKSHGHFILGYVIMPNHVHVIVAFRHTRGEPINRLIGTGKRFMAYFLVKRLKETLQFDLLDRLEKMVTAYEKRKGKQHEIFEPSFDWKECTSEKFIIQKLNYIHENPCRGKWQLSSDPQGYKHSSASFYINGYPGGYSITSYEDIQDVDLTKWIDE